MSIIRGDRKPVDRVVINGEVIKRDNYSSISDGSYVFIYPENEQSIEFYRKDTSHKISFYKFFPMGDQLNNLNFILHHYKFKVKTDRRKLQETGNKDILNDIWIDLKDKLNVIKEEDKIRFIEIIINFYLSDLQKANGNYYIVENFTKYIFEYIKLNIPVVEYDVYGMEKISFVSDKSLVKIIDSRFHVPLKKFKNFYFDIKNNDIIKNAIDKLKLDRFNIVDVLINDNVDSWIFSLSDDDFMLLLHEIKVNKKSELNIIKSFNGFYSLDEMKRILKIFQVIRFNKISFAVLHKDGFYSISSLLKNTYIKNDKLRLIIQNKYPGYNLIPNGLEQHILDVTLESENDEEVIKSLLEGQQHRELIDFIDQYDLRNYFLKTINRLDLFFDKKYNENSFEMIVLKMANEVNDDFIEKVYIENARYDSSFVSRYISFKYGTKVINPMRWENKESDQKMDDFISSLGEFAKDIFKLKEDSKEKVYEFIRSEISKNNYKINTINRLKFIVLYCLEDSSNYIKFFNGVKINKSDKTVDGFQSLYKILTCHLRNINIKDVYQKDIFKIKELFPDYLEKDYYLSDESIAISSEKLPDNMLNEYLDVFKNIGLNIDYFLEDIRRKIVAQHNINSDDLIRLSSRQIANTIEFLSYKEIEYDVCKSNNLVKLLSKIESEEKKKLFFLPCLVSKNTLKIKEVRSYALTNDVDLEY